MRCIADLWFAQAMAKAAKDRLPRCVPFRAEIGETSRMGSLFFSYGPQKRQAGFRMWQRNQSDRPKTPRDLFSRGLFEIRLEE